MESISSDEQIKLWREELLGFLKQMYEFKKIKDPIVILPMISGFSVRARYIAAVAAASSQSRAIKDFRYEEVLPFLTEADNQRQLWSRVGTLIKDEWEMAKG
jgi:hypothetical protein